VKRTRARRLEALLVLSLMPGLRPGELRKLTQDDVDLDQGIIRVAFGGQGPVTSGRLRQALVVLPRPAVQALRQHKKGHGAERLKAGALYHETGLVFCSEDGRMFSRWALDWWSSNVTQGAGIGHWHAHEDRHTPPC
jgi:integrase